MADLLLELFSEEIPARMQVDAARQLQDTITKRFSEAGITFDAAEHFSTPRRIGIYLAGLPKEQPDVSEERKGPRVGAPEKAVEGFLRAAGLDSLDQCETREDKKGAFYVAVIEKKGGKTADVIAEMVPEVVRGFHWPKSMRWGTGTLRWVRPLHSILCTLDGKVVPFEVDGIEAGEVTYGHRFHAPEAIKAPTFDKYKERLREARVVLSRTERKDIIWREATHFAESSGLELERDDALLEEVAGLVEWPMALMGKFDESYLEVPEEVLITAMRSHQKYFAVRDPKTANLANKFIFVSNLEADDGGKAIIAGNERVLNARLSDAKFFWDQDRKVKLLDRRPELAEIIFYDKLGTVLQKTERLSSIAGRTAALLERDGSFAGCAEQAGKLCKSDLVSGMVFEFPELQGIMGRYYAIEEGLDDRISDAIAEHYSPAGPNDICPTKPVSVSVSLADKVDTLVGFWALQELPTGSKDPFALRRAALGIIRIILENGLRLQLSYLSNLAYCSLLDQIPPENADKALAGIDEKLPKLKQLAAAETTGPWKHIVAAVREFVEDEYARPREIYHTVYRVLEADVISGDTFREPSEFDREASDIVRRASALLFEDLAPFFAERLKVYLRDKGARHDLIDAVFALGDQDDLVAIVARVEALGEFLDTQDGQNLLAGYKRAVNILHIEEKKDKKSYDGKPVKKLMSETAEKVLADAIAEADKAVAAALKTEDFKGAMAAVAKLRAPVDKFFDDVTVNADKKDVRVNRLNLLNQIRASLEGVADFSKIEG